MTLNGVMAVTLRYFTEFGKPAFQHITAPICGGIYARVFFVVRVQCRRKESSCSLSHLLMSFLFLVTINNVGLCLYYLYARTLHLSFSYVVSMCKCHM